MILRLSHKLNMKIKAGTLPVMPLDDNPNADWSCQLFTAEGNARLVIRATAGTAGIR